METYFLYLKLGNKYVPLIGGPYFDLLGHDSFIINEDEVVISSRAILEQDGNGRGTQPTQASIFFVVPLGQGLFLRRSLESLQDRPEDVRNHCLEIFSDLIPQDQIDAYRFVSLRQERISSQLNENTLFFAIENNLIEELGFLTKSVGAEQFWIFPEHTFLRFLSTGLSSDLHDDALNVVILDGVSRFYIVQDDQPFLIELDVSTREIVALIENEDDSLERLHFTIAPIIASHLSFFESKYRELSTNTVHIFFPEYTGSKNTSVLMHDGFSFSYELDRKILNLDIQNLLKQKLSLVKNGGNDKFKLPVYGPIDTQNFHALEVKEGIFSNRKIRQVTYLAFTVFIVACVVCLAFLIKFQKDLDFALVEKNTVTQEIQGIESRLVEREQFLSNIGLLDFYGTSFDKGLQVIESLLPRDIRVERIEARRQNFQIAFISSGKERMAEFIETLRKQPALDISVLTAEEVRIPSELVPPSRATPYKAVIRFTFKEVRE